MKIQIYYSILIQLSQGLIPIYTILYTTKTSFLQTITSSEEYLLLKVEAVVIMHTTQNKWIWSNSHIDLILA